MNVLCNPIRKTMLAASALTLALLWSSTAAAVEAGEPAPDFTLPGVRASDPEVQLSTLQGKVVYVDFWASWCLPCLRSLPQINGLYEQYREQGFEVVAITIDDPVEDATEFLDDLEVPLVYAVVLDATADVMDQYRVVGMPTSFLIDREGVIRKVHKGFREGDTELLEQELLPLLAE